jgi:hypothetical protein
VWFRSSGAQAAPSLLPALSTPGGSVVDPSLLRLAADRGVTICFADLDGADGLWVPEERTVLVNRRLSEREVAEVIAHELGHVAIDDQHADLDAAVGRPPPASSRRWAAALTAAACLAVVGGVTAGLARTSEGAIEEGPVVAPSAPPLTAAPPGPGEAVTTKVVIGPDGRMLIRTMTLTATPSGPTPAATSAGKVAPTSTGPAPIPPSAPTATSAAPTTSQPPDTGSPTPAPTTPEATDPPASTPAGEPDDGLEDDVTSPGDGGTSSVAPVSTS